MNQLSKNYLFVDESGDPHFYSKRGKYIVGSEWCSSYLQFSLVQISNPKSARKLIQEAVDEILHDNLLAWIPSIEKRRWKFHFHACMDVPEVRDRFLRVLHNIDFKSIVIHLPKDQALFHSKYIAKTEVFYHDIVSQLFKHAGSMLWKDNVVYFEKRGKKNKQEALLTSIKNALASNNMNISFEVLVQTPTDEPCLQIADYINWIVQRSLISGEPRFYQYLSHKIVEIIIPNNKKIPL